jgi:hypothetical protein
MLSILTKYLEKLTMTKRYVSNVQKLNFAKNYFQPFQGLLAECQSQHAKAMLFIFCVSNIVVLSSPVARFETPYLQLFRVLDLARYGSKCTCFHD